MRRILRGAIVCLLCALLASCTPVDAPSTQPTHALVAPGTERPARVDTAELAESLGAVLAASEGYLTRGAEVFDVWVCVVPVGTTASDFEPQGIRLDLDPTDIASRLTATVTPYFTELSGGAYLPQFITGGTFELGADEGPSECLRRAMADSRPDVTGVIAVATAEQAAGTAGGFGTPGTPCPAASAWPCAASETGRGVYLGASDFHPDWGAVPAVDLLEHEIGHVLGWPHSGAPGDAYASAIDVMSNSAAPRTADPSARNGQGTLAINRVAAGWIPVDDLVVVPPTGVDVELHPSGGAAGTRVAVVPLDDARFLTIEYIVAEGLQSSLPSSGVTITLVDIATASCPGTTDTIRECRTQLTLVGEPPFTDLLGPGARWSGEGWEVSVSAGSVPSTIIARAAPLP